MEVWIPIIIFIGVPLAIVAAVVYALVRIRKRREKDNAQASRAEDEVDPQNVRLCIVFKLSLITPVSTEIG